jgi:hypothetical protein
MDGSSDGNLNSKSHEYSLESGQECIVASREDNGRIFIASTEIAFSCMDVIN